jgi:hypothetical protein
MTWQTKTYGAWAFRAAGWQGWPDQPERPPFLAGIYCFEQWRLLRSSGPIGTALFETRREAREAAKKAKLKGQAVRVAVTITAEHR